MGVRDPMIYKKPGCFFSESRAPEVLRHLVAIESLLLNLSTPPWIVHVLQRPHAWFEGAILPKWVSLVR